MDSQSRNLEIAGSVFRAGLLDEPTLRRALAETGSGDLAAFLVSSLLVQPDALTRALAAQVPAPSVVRTPTRRDFRISNPNLQVPRLDSGDPGDSPGARTIAALPPAPVQAPPVRSGSGTSGRLVASEALTVQLPGGSRAAGTPSSGRIRAAGSGEFAATSSAIASPTPSQDASFQEALRSKPGSELPPGMRLGPYILKKLLAKGGMGAVFVAEHATIQRTVALKVLLAGEQASEEQIARFLTEARTTSRLNHPNVVPVYEVGQAGSVHYLTMEYVQGPSLRHLIKEKGPLTPRRALHFLEQIARGVEAAHEQGIIHRDLKPENVLIAPGDVAKVMDFGLAKDTGEAAGRRMTVSGAILGTPSYMAPEQAGGEKVGPLADVYGLGAILYECLTGKPPFDGSTLAAIITAVLTTDPVPPSALRPRLNRDVETICLRAMEKEPEKRYASAKDLADDAARWLGGEAILARPMSRFERAARWTRRHFAQVAATGAGGLVAVATLVWFLAIAPAIERNRAETELAAKNTDRKAQAEAFDKEAKAALQRVQAAGALVTTTPSSREAALKTVKKESDALKTAFAALDPEVQKLVATPRPFVDEDAAKASLWLAQGRVLDAAALAKDARPEDAETWRREAREAYAWAYATAPVSDAGREAIAEVAMRGTDAASRELVEHLHRTKLPASVATKIRLAVARIRLSNQDVAGALQELELVARDPGSSSDRAATDEAARIARFLRPLRSICDPEEVVPAQWARLVPGKPARLQVALGDGSGRTFVIDRATGTLRHEADGDIPGPAEHLLGSETPGHARIGGPLSRPIMACFTSGRRLLLWGKDGRLLDEVDAAGNVKGKAVFPRNAAIDRAQNLRFVELDGDPETTELVCAVGPNEGDGLFLRIDARGRVFKEDLDPFGRTVDGRGACYISAVENAVLGGSPRLVLAYAEWGAHHLSFFGNDVARPLAKPTVVGTVTALHAVEIEGTSCLVAGQADVPNTKTGDEQEITDPCLAVYACDGSSVTRPPLYVVKPMTWQPALEGIYPQWLRLGMTVARLGGKPIVLWKEFGPKAMSGLLRAAELGKSSAEALFEVPLTDESGWSVLATGDADGEGKDVLVVGGPRGIRVLGSAAGKPEPERKPEPPIDDETARAQALYFLDKLEFFRQALDVNERNESKSGTTRESDEIAIACLKGLEAAPPPDPAFLEKSDDFLKMPGRRSIDLGRVHVLRARHFFRGEDTPENGAAALAEARKAQAGDLGNEEARTVKRMARVLELRGQAGQSTRSVLDVAFAGRGEAAPKEETLRQLIANDPLRLALDPERGLVAAVCRRVRVYGGVPVNIPAGPIRMTVDFNTRGRTWGGFADVGLFREVGAGFAGEHAVIERFTVGEMLWNVGPYRQVRQGIYPDIGESSPSGEAGEGGGFQDLAEDDTHPPASFTIGVDHFHRCRLRAVLEHDPKTRWAKFVVRDRDDGPAPGRILHSQEGTAAFALSPGPYVAGIFSPGSRGGDYHGGNFPPEAWLGVERIRIEQVNAVQQLSLTACDPARGMAAAVAGGKSVLLERGCGTLAEAISAYDPALGLGGTTAAKLLVFRADARARNGDGSGTRADLTRALDADPYAFFRAVEDDARLLDDRTAAVLREVLRDAVIAADAELAKKPDDAALQEKRATVQLLRGERQEAYQAFQRLLDRKNPRRSVVYLLGAALSTEETIHLWEALRGLDNTPELPEFFRSFWLPLVPPPDLDGYMKTKLEQARDREILVWFQRWIELRPERTDLRLSRAKFFLGQSFGANLRWQVLEDLRRTVGIEAKTPEARRIRIEALGLLGLYEAAELNYRDAAEHLRAARQEGLDPRQILERLKGLESDPGFEDFRREVLR